MSAPDSGMPRQVRRQVEQRVYGAAAAAAVFERRPQDIVKAYVDRAATAAFSSLLKALAARRIAYKLVEADDLQRLTETPHHGGVCLLVKRPVHPPLDALLQRLATRPRACLLLLEDVGNPHNIGAILRSAAHFGVDGMLLPEPRLAESGAVARTAAGGAEAVPVVGYADLGVLERLAAAGFTTVATSSHEGESLFEAALPAKCVFLFGEEQAGLSGRAFAASATRVRVPGTGAVESLNVSVAAALMMAEHWRRHVATGGASAPAADKGAPGAARRVLTRRRPG